ncbi:flagellar basal body-associated FliL family protein [Acetivibrio saccincola]|uniref:Flagellar protein FliL n=1 Tax=Acetivibrio saccincola TaxID=1677857 RepID=A0A2S8RDJ4_9FIRM|nr:flagellar basal body-associated FliL family protein [Acetivibrio saccincola]PQQ67859.1 flagellar basal body-associated protein FliL [Acetivibrio saccincola]
MESRGSFIILISIVAVLSLTLALLAGYVWLGQNSNPVSAKDPHNQNVRIPLEKELIKEKLFDEKTAFNLKSEDSGKTSVIVVSVELSYFKKVKGIKNTTAKIEANKGKLQEIVGTYFQKLTVDDVADVEFKEKAREELTALMNEFLLSNENSKENIIYTIVFEQWFYQ